MPRPADKIPENIDFVVQELLEAPEADRPAMLENIAKPLTAEDQPGDPGSPGAGGGESKDPEPTPVRQAP